MITFIDLAGHEKYLKTTGWSLHLTVNDESKQCSLGSEWTRGEEEKNHPGKFRFFLSYPIFLYKTPVGEKNVDLELRILVKCLSVLKSLT